MGKYFRVNPQQNKKQWKIVAVLCIFFLTAGVFCLDITRSNDTAAASRAANDLQLLARCVNGEARGEPYEGQVAVAAVILNRVKHPSFPNTISGVIYQPGAFTATVDGQINVPISTNSTVYKACQDAMNGWDPTGGAIYYYNPAKTTNQWIFSREVIKIIGQHRFAR